MIILCNAMWLHILSKEATSRPIVHQRVLEWWRTQIKVLCTIHMYVLFQYNKYENNEYLQVITEN
jgi:hypothetical protein